MASIHNDYSKTIDNFDRIPKTIFAAIAASLMVNIQGVSFDKIDDAIYQEWQVLYKNGIVKTKPNKQL